MTSRSQVQPSVFFLLTFVLIKIIGIVNHGCIKSHDVISILETELYMNFCLPVSAKFHLSLFVRNRYLSV